MRRSQSRRSSNTLPIRPLGGNASAIGRPSVTSTLPTATTASAQKRSSSIPRPSFSTVKVGGYGQKHDQSLGIGTTPSKANAVSRLSGMTPQHGGMTPQSRANMTATVSNKAFLKETRNLSDKNCVLEMMKNVATFLTDSAYPEYVSHKEIQKIDKHSFIKYFNYVYSFIDPHFQLAPRFNEDELIKSMKDLGYCGTLAKSALVSIGALHSTSQIVGLLSWLADFARMLQHEPEDESLDMAELQIMVNGYIAWCTGESVDLEDQFRGFYRAKYQIDEERAEMVARQIQAIQQEYHIIEKKSSQLEELKSEVKDVERKLDTMQSKEATLKNDLKQLQAQEKTMDERLNEQKEKVAAVKNEIADLLTAAKNCKVSAEEARRIKAEIAANKRECASGAEQRDQIAKLVEKRELQLANIAAEHIKLDRELNVELMDMGMTVGPDEDPKEALKKFLDSKTVALSDMESRCIAATEKRERVLAEISQLKMELKHSELQKVRLEENLISVKADRDEMERLLLSQLAELESLSAAPRSDPLEMRLKYELETLRQKFAEQKALINKQEKELQMTVGRNAQELKDLEAQLEKTDDNANAYYGKLAIGFQQLLIAAEKGTITDDMIRNFIPEPDFA